MDVLITGAGGFLGGLLAARVAAADRLAGSEVGDITLLCRREPATLAAAAAKRCRIVLGDAADEKLLAQLVVPGMSIFHLAAVVSGAGEQDFDLVLRTNLDGTRALLECARAAGGCTLVFAGSAAVFSAGQNALAGDLTKQNPQTTYGMTKAIAELLINDYARKDYVDGRTARLPTVIVRPGRPNQAASSFASGMFREPLAGTDCTIPVSRDIHVPLTGYASVIDGILALHDIDAAKLGADRAVGLPVLNVTVGGMLDCLERLRAKRPDMGAATIRPDPFIEQICAGWPQAIDNSRAARLGLPAEQSLDGIIARYIADYVDI